MSVVLDSRTITYRDHQIFILRICVGKQTPDTLKHHFTIIVGTLDDDNILLTLLKHCFDELNGELPACDIVLTYSCVERHLQTDQFILDFNYTMAFLFTNPAVYYNNLDLCHMEYIFSTELAMVLCSKGLTVEQTKTFVQVLLRALVQQDTDIQDRFDAWVSKNRDATPENQTKIDMLRETLQQCVLQPYYSLFSECIVDLPHSPNTQRTIHPEKVVQYIRENFTDDVIQKIRNALSSTDTEEMSPGTILFNFASDRHQNTIDAVKHIKAEADVTKEHVFVDWSYFTNIPVPKDMFEGIFIGRETGVNLDEVRNNFSQTADVYGFSNTTSPRLWGEMKFEEFILNRIMSNNRNIIPEIHETYNVSSVPGHAPENCTSSEPETKRRKLEEPVADTSLSLRIASNNFLRAMNSFTENIQIKMARDIGTFNPLNMSAAKILPQNAVPAFPLKKWIYVNSIVPPCENMVQFRTAVRTPGYKNDAIMKKQDYLHAPNWSTNRLDDCVFLWKKMEKKTLMELVKTRKLKSFTLLAKDMCVLVFHGNEENGRKILSRKIKKTQLSYKGVLSYDVDKSSKNWKFLVNIRRLPVKFMVSNLKGGVMYLCDSFFSKSGEGAPMTIVFYLCIELRALCMLKVNVPSSRFKILHQQTYRDELVFYYMEFEFATIYNDVVFACLENWMNVMYNLPPKANILDVVNYTRPAVQILCTSGISLYNDPALYILNETRRLLIDEFGNYTAYPTTDTEYNAVIYKFAMTAALLCSQKREKSIISGEAGPFLNICSIKGIQTMLNDDNYNKDFTLDNTAPSVVCSTFIPKKQYSAENAFHIS